MKAIIKILCLFVIIELSGCITTDDAAINFKPQHNQPSKTNFGHNIILAVDLSNRILNERRYDDPEIVQLVGSNLKTVFQKGIDLGINDKFYLTTINDKDFNSFKYSDSIFKIDLTKFKTDAVNRANYLYHNDNGSNSLKYNLIELNKNFTLFYDALRSKKQNGADMWYFMRDKLTYPVVDTSSVTYEFGGTSITNKYENNIILITDGYIEAGRYGNSPDMRENNKFRFLSEQTINDFRSSLKKSQIKDFKLFFEEAKYGIMPVPNECLADCKILVLEIFDRSKKGGVSTIDPTDGEIINLFWSDWLLKSGFKKSNITLKETFGNRQILDETIKNFLGVK